MLAGFGLTRQEPYLMRFSVVDCMDVFSTQRYREIFKQSLQYCVDHKGLELSAWTLMSDHAHLVAKAGKEEKLYEIVRDLKKFTSKKIVAAISENDDPRKDWMLYRFHFSGFYDKKIKNFRFWEEGNRPICCDTPELLKQSIDFVHHNSVRAGIVADAAHYRYCSAFANAIDPNFTAGTTRKP